MGNLCFGKKKPKQPKTPQTMNPTNNPTDLKSQNLNDPLKNPNIKTQPIDSPKPKEQVSNNPKSLIVSDNTKHPIIVNEDRKQNVKYSEKETNISKNDYSFAKVRRTGENKFSFEVYGEGVSALNPKFLMDNLGNISNNSKINISRNDLLLLTEENQEILKFLSANNITHKDLIEGIRKEHSPGTIALDEKLRITGTMIQSNIYFKKFQKYFETF